MNRKEAMQLNDKLKQFLEEQAVRLGLEKSAGTEIVDCYIEIYPDEMPVMGMLDLKEKGSASVKPGNVLVNQKGILLSTCVGLVTSYAIPKTILDYIKLGLLAGIAIYTTAKVELSEQESYIAAYLHVHQMYDIGDQENEFYIKFPAWYQQQTGDEISNQRVKTAVGNLLELESIEIVEGEIRLKEKVWRNRLTE